MASPYKWPLAVANHRWSDKLRLASFILSSNHWTNGKMVRRFETEMAARVGCKYCIFTSSGSTANTLLAMYLKDTLPPERRTVVLPIVTWTTSCAPWIREGFHPHFVDVSLHDYSMNIGLLDHWLSSHASEVACVFITSLLGFAPDIEGLKELAAKHNVLIMLDNCESTLSEYRNRNLSAWFTSTLSTYFAHHLQSVEGGFICTDDEALLAFCLKARDHGLTRVLRTVDNIDAEAHFNPAVDWRFDFGVLGSNFRNSEINALLGRMELKRWADYQNLREHQYELFLSLIDRHNFQFPISRDYARSIPFSLPLVCRRPGSLKLVRKACEFVGVETRPLVGGNLLKHSAYKRFRPEYYPTADIEKYVPDYSHLSVADYLHANACYVGLGNCTNDDLIRQLAARLNALFRE